MPSYLTSIVLQWSADSLTESRITNPTFDVGITGWTETDSGGASLTPTHDTTVTHSGAGSMKLVNTAGGEDDYMQATFTGVAGVTYQIRAWVNVTVFTAGAAFNLGLRAFDPGAGAIDDDNITAATDGWTLKELALTPVVSGTVAVRLYAPQGTTYWDDVTVIGWTTVANSEIQSLEWWAGIDREGNDPEPGGMRVTLKNKLRKWEPLFGSNLIDTQQRFRLTLNGTREGVWYTESFDLDYPAGQEFSWVTISCGDGISVLALDDLPTLDPPEAETYEDVVNFYEPWGYWRLGEEEGTKARPRIIRGFKGKGKKRRKIKRRRGSIYSTREEAGAASGASGIYKNNPGLGQAGAIVGDTDTCVLFDPALDQYVRVPVEAEDLIDSNRLTVTAWIYAASVDASDGNGIVSGPYSVGADESVWRLSTVDAGAGAIGVLGVIEFTSGGSSVVRSTDESVFLTLDTWTFVAMTWNGHALRVFMDGVEVASGGEYETLRAGTAGNDLLIGAYSFVGAPPDGFFDGLIDEVAVWERALTPEQIMNLYVSGVECGYGQQTAGERIAALASSTLWADTEIQTTGRDVLPIMHHGQPKLDELAEAVHAEGPRTMFFFNGSGAPVYLGHEWQETNANYDTVQWTFTDDGTGKPYNHVQVEYDFETFNEVLASHESGESVTVTDTTESGKRGRRVNSEFTDVLLVEHMDVEALAAGVLDYYKEPAKRPVTLTIDSYHCLAQILDLDIGHLIHVKKQGETGAATERVQHIINKRKTMQMVAGGGLVSATYTLSRGFDPTGGTWILGYNGYSELGQTTELA